MPKLEPLKQWICDTCGDIVTIDDGWLEWIDDLARVAEFRIVHHRTACQQHLRRRGVSNLDLRHFVGADGLQNFLSYLDVGPILAPDGVAGCTGQLEVRAFVDTVRRLHIPYYEEARTYFAAAQSEGWFSDQNEVSIFLPETCRSIIERYQGT